MDKCPCLNSALLRQWPCRGAMLRRVLLPLLLLFHGKCAEPCCDRTLSLGSVNGRRLAGAQREAHALELPFDLKHFSNGTPPSVAYNASTRYFVFNLLAYDGVGAQMAQLLQAQCIAQHSAPAFTYLHVGFRHISHGEVNHSAEWDAYLAMGVGRLWVRDVNFTTEQWAARKQLARVSDRLSPTKLRAPGIYEARRGAVSVSPRVFDECLPVFKRQMAQSTWLFAEPQPARLHCTRPRCLCVALHVRRGDILHKDDVQHTDVYVPDAWYLALLKAIRICLPNKLLDVHIVSEGETTDFEAFRSLNVTLHLSDPPYVVLDLLMHSDVLVMGSSSFSFLAAVFHDGRAVVTNGERFAAAHGHLVRSKDWVGAPVQTPSAVADAVNCTHLQARLRDKSAAHEKAAG